MLTNKKVLLLVGSPKAKGSTSVSLGNYLLESLTNKGCECEQFQVLTGEKDNIEEIVNKIRETDILVITAPLYVDSLPAPLIRVLEHVDRANKQDIFVKKQSLVAIVNSGFPEAFQNDTAIKICKNFGKRNNFKWLGGLTMGCGPAVSGRPINQLGGMTRNIVKALDMAAESIAKDEPITPEAIELISKKMFPIWLYMLFGNQNWKTIAKKFNIQKQLNAKPYGS